MKAVSSVPSPSTPLSGPFRLLGDHAWNEKSPTRIRSVGTGPVAFKNNNPINVMGVRGRALLAAVTEGKDGDFDVGCGAAAAVVTGAVSPFALPFASGLFWFRRRFR